jgi:hypothetical protein
MNLDSIFDRIYQATIKQAALVKKAKMTTDMAETLHVKLFYLGYSDARGNLPINQELNEHKEYSRGFAAGEEANKDILGGPYNTGWEEWKKAMQEQAQSKTTPVVPPVSAPANPSSLPATIDFGTSITPAQTFLGQRKANISVSAQVSDARKQLHEEFRKYFKEVLLKFKNLHQAGTNSDQAMKFILGRPPINDAEKVRISSGIVQATNVLETILAKLNSGKIPAVLLIKPESFIDLCKDSGLEVRMSEILETPRRMDLVEKLKNSYKS